LIGHCWTAFLLTKQYFVATIIDLNRLNSLLWISCIATEGPIFRKREGHAK